MSSVDLDDSILILQKPCFRSVAGARKERSSFSHYLVEP